MEHNCRTQWTEASVRKSNGLVMNSGMVSTVAWAAQRDGSSAREGRGRPPYILRDPTAALAKTTQDNWSERAAAAVAARGAQQPSRGLDRNHAERRTC